MGLPVITPGLCSPMIVSYSSIIHAMISGVVYTSGAGTSPRLGEEAADGADVRARKAFLLPVGELLGVAGDSALGAAQRQVDDRRLPGHPRGQRAHGVDRLVGVPAQTALGGAARAVVLDAVAVEDADAPVVHADGEGDLQLALRPAEKLVRRLVQAERGGRRVELLLGDLEGIEFCHECVSLLWGFAGTIALSNSGLQDEPERR